MTVFNKNHYLLPDILIIVLVFKITTLVFLTMILIFKIILLAFNKII